MIKRKDKFLLHFFSRFHELHVYKIKSEIHGNVLDRKQKCGPVGKNVSASTTDHAYVSISNENSKPLEKPNAIQPETLVSDLSTPSTHASFSLPSHSNTSMEVESTQTISEITTTVLPHTDDLAEEKRPIRRGRIRTCSICKKVMARSNLARHMREVHKLSKEKIKELNQVPVEPVTLTGDQLACSVCGKAISRSNYRRHMRVHSTSPERFPGDVLDEVLVVSPKEGLYLVPRNIHKGGNRHPIHVQYSVSSACQKIRCESERCVDQSNAYRDAALSTFKCEHVAAVGLSKDIVHPDQRQLQEGDLDDLIDQGIIELNSWKQMNDIMDEAVSKGVPLAVHSTIFPSSSFMYISLFSAKITNYAKLGRLVICYSRKSGKFHCPCARSYRINCLHKEIARAHLFLNKPELMEMKDTDVQKSNNSEVELTDPINVFQQGQIVSVFV